jgi:hypothetical protein
MADFNVRADAVDVEQIMQQIRGRIRDKRGVDYTEDQIQELAKVKLEKFLDPRGIRSDLLEQFRSRPSDVPPTYPFDDQTLFASSKPLVRFIRKLLRPVLKLLFNSNALNHVLHTQVGINDFLMARAARDVLVYEVMHNLVVEVTRASIDVKNTKMRVESIASRLEFNERRARALEAVVQYRPDGERGRDHDRDRERRGGESRPQSGPAQEQGAGPVDPLTGGDSLRSRRKRRRRGRRSGPGFGEAGEAGPQASATSHQASGASQMASEDSHQASEARGPRLEAGDQASSDEAGDAASRGLRSEAIDPASSES